MTPAAATTRAASDHPAVGWRLAREPYADLSGEGSRLNGGRWNSRGKAVVYLAEDAALPVLEVLVHLDLTPDMLPDDYVLMRVTLSEFEGAGGAAWLEHGPADLLDEADSRAFGDRWIEEARTPVLRVPSVLVPESLNLLLNPNHPAAATLTDPTHRRFAFDPRLFDYGSDEDE